MTADRAFDVTLYGATGYTGELIARGLDARGASFRLAGRDPTRLATVAASLPSKPPWTAVDATDREGLRGLARETRVLLSAAGPFVRLGPPLLDAAIRGGAHFADITGEQSFLRHAWGRRAEAEAAGVTVVNALGFDVVPSDAAAAAATEGLDDVVGLDIVIAVKGTNMSDGTKRSMAQSSRHWWLYRDGRYVRAVPGRYRKTFRFPEPLRDRAAVFIPWGDVVTAPRTAGARAVRTFFAVPPAQARALHLAWPLTDLAGRLPILRRRRGPPSDSRRGPTPEERAAARFTILAEATRRDGSVHRAVASGRDPYGLTAIAASSFSLDLAAGRVGERGVLTPTQAFGVEGIVKTLAEVDLEVRRLPPASS